MSRRNFIWIVATPLGIVAAVLSGIYFDGTGTAAMGAVTSGIGVGILVWLLVALVMVAIGALIDRRRRHAAGR
jgi:uncharacterized membrane protein YhaH (DUF805 family)